MSAQILLDRLEGVRRTTSDRWMARCPAHDDRRPSLSIRESSDGTILLRCFAGCEAADIVSALELRLSDLFPEGSSKPQRPCINREAMDHERLIVEIANHDLSNDIPLSDQDFKRVDLALHKLEAMP